MSKNEKQRIGTETIERTSVERLREKLAACHAEDNPSNDCPDFNYLSSVPFAAVTNLPGAMTGTGRRNPDNENIHRRQNLITDQTIERKLKKGFCSSFPKLSQVHQSKLAIMRLLIAIQILFDVH